MVIGLIGIILVDALSASFGPEGGSSGSGGGEKVLKSLSLGGGCVFNELIMIALGESDFWFSREDFSEFWR